MPRIIRLTALVAVLVPLAAACSDSERATTSTASMPTSGSTNTVSTGATPPAADDSGTTPGGVKPVGAGAVVPSYTDAERAFHRGRYEEAAGMFQAYSESNPDNAWGRYMLGLSSWKAGDHTRALEAFDAALRLEPTHRKSLLNSARVLLETNRPQDALDRVERALAVEPLSSEALRLAGRAHFELGEFDEAIDAYQRALAIDDRDVWAMNNLGYLYIQQGRTDAALPPLARAVELRRNVPVFQNNFGTALERSGHFASAAQAYEAAVAADSTYTKAAAALERVRAHGTESDTSSVDVVALSRQFQADVEQWRTRAVTGDSVETVTPMPAADSSRTVNSSSSPDSTQVQGTNPPAGAAPDSASRMARDSGQ